MKPAKSKRLSPKALLIDHGEKIFFGLIAVVALAIVGMSDWSRTERNPDTLLNKAQDADRKIASSNWSDEARKPFSIVSFMDRASQLRQTFAAVKYEFSTPLYWPLYRKRELAKEPEFLAVEYLEAKAGLAALAIQPEDSGDETPGMTPDPSVSPLDEDNEFASRNTAGDSAFPVAPGITPGAPAGAAAFAPTAAMMATKPGRGKPSGPVSPPPAGAAGAAGMYMGMGMAGMSGMSGPERESRGQRFVAVRGVYPLRQQQERLQKALGKDSVMEVASLMNILDFVMERQEAVAGNDPWAGPWEKLDLDANKAVLMESPFDSLDPVDPSVTDAVITSPLPERLMGSWGDYATHPRIKNFELSPAAIKQRAALESMMMQQFEESKLQENAPVERKGFATVQRDMRSMGNQLFASDSGATATQNMMKNMSGMSGNGMPAMPMMNAQRGKMQPQDLQLQLTAAGQLMLFRYLDFDVRPGKAYRYRVKLILNNPNFGLPREQAADTAVVTGEQRESPFSNISNPTVVPDTTRYFVESVDRDPVRTPDEQRKPITALKYFEWEPKYGTWLQTELKLSSIGHYIMDKKKVEHLDLGKQKYVEEESLIGTEDVLIDAVADLGLNPADHPDLQLKHDASRSRAFVLALDPTVLVVDQTGSLRELGPGTGADREKILEKQYKDQTEAHKALKETATEASALDRGYGGAAGTQTPADMMAMYAGGMNKKKKSGSKAKANPMISPPPAR